MKKLAVESMPQSWAIPDHPRGVYPGDPSKMKYLSRAYRDELMACGALARIGRDLVVLGAGYAAWLAKNQNRVHGFEIAPNRDRAEKKAA